MTEAEVLAGLHSPHALLHNPDLETVPGIQDLVLDGGARPGDHTLRWSTVFPARDFETQPLPAVSNSPRVRIYMRATREPFVLRDVGYPGGGGLAEHPVVENEWTTIGETSGMAWPMTELGTLEVYDFAVGEADSNGTYQTPDVALQLLAVTIPEFPAVRPPDAQLFRSYVKDDGVLLQWDPVADRDVMYEIRQGPGWTYGVPIACTTCQEFFHQTPPRTTQPYRLRAVNPHGIGGKTSTIAGANWLPHARILDTENEEYPSLATPAGTITNLTYDDVAREMRLATGKYSGTYESAVLDLTTSEPRYWWATVFARGNDNDTVDDWDFACHSGEALFREVDDREATYMKSGGDLVGFVDQAALFVDQLPDTILVKGIDLTWPYAVVIVEARFDTGGGFGAYARWPACTQLVTAQKMQVRIYMARQDLTRQFYTLDLRVGASDAPAPPPDGATESHTFIDGDSSTHTVEVDDGIVKQWDIGGGG